MACWKAIEISNPYKPVCKISIFGRPRFWSKIGYDNLRKKSGSGSGTTNRVRHSLSPRSPFIASSPIRFFEIFVIGDEIGDGSGTRSGTMVVPDFRFSMIAMSRTRSPFPISFPIPIFLNFRNRVRDRGRDRVRDRERDREWRIVVPDFSNKIGDDEGGCRTRPVPDPDRVREFYTLTL